MKWKELLKQDKGIETKENGEGKGKEKGDEGWKMKDCVRLHLFFLLACFIFSKIHLR